MLYKRCCLSVILLLFGLSLQAQEQDTDRIIDSLKIEAGSAKVDTVKAKLLYNVGAYFMGENAPDSTLYYGLKAAGYYEKGGNTRMAAVTRSRLASVYRMKKEDQQAIALYRQAKEVLDGLKESDAVLAINSELASVYEQRGDGKTALSYYQENVSRSKKEQNDSRLLTSMSQLQAFYNEQNNEPMALKTGMELLELARKGNNRKIMAHAYLDIGNSYFSQRNYGPDIDYFKKALDLFKALKDTIGVTKMERNIGSSYASLKQYDSSITYLRQAQKTYQTTGNYNGQADILNSIAAVYFSQKQYGKARESLEEGIKITSDKNLKLFYRLNLHHLVANELYGKKTTGRLTEEDLATLARLDTDFTKTVADYEKTNPDPGTLYPAYATLSDVKELHEDYKGALQYHEKAIDLRDSINSTQKQVEFAQLESRYTYEAARDSLKLAEEQKRLGLQKEIELKALRFEYERKQAAARTEVERRKLILEEEFKRRQIESEYARKQTEAQAKFDRQSALAQAEQDKKAALANAELKRANTLRNMSLLGAMLFLLLAGTAVRAYFQKRKDNKVIAQEKGKSEALLLNILPAEIAEELKNEGKSKAQHFREVTVLFTDFVNFTRIAEQLEPEDLIAELNICFTAFDNIMERYGLEKIKTIGDAYLAVSGLPVQNPRHAQNAVNAALDIVTFINRRKADSTLGFDIRVGINSGPLVAGIVGVKKFAYDIWGDTVNIASRMETNSEPGKINISENTFQLLNDEFTCIHRGRLAAKNKGEMDMYFVSSKK